MNINPFSVNEFGEVLAFTFKVIIDLILSEVFFNFCGIILKMLMMILTFEFLYLRDDRITSYLKVVTHAWLLLEFGHFHENRVRIVCHVFLLKIEFAYKSMVLF